MSQRLLFVQGAKKLTVDIAEIVRVTQRQKGKHGLLLIARFELHNEDVPLALRLGLYHELDDLIAKASVGLADLGEKTLDVSQYTLRVGPFTRDRWVGWDFPLAGLIIASGDQKRCQCGRARIRGRRCGEHVCQTGLDGSLLGGDGGLCATAANEEQSEEEQNAHKEVSRRTP